MKNIQNLISYKKGYIDLYHQMPSSPQNSHVISQMVKLIIAAGELCLGSFCRKFSLIYLSHWS